MRTIALVICLLVTPACGPKVVLTTPEGHIAYAADQVSLRVTELERTAISANAAGKLSEADTRVILTFADAAQKTLAQTPQGWQASLKTAWQATRGQLSSSTNPAIASAVSLVDALMEGL